MSASVWMSNEPELSKTEPLPLRKLPPVQTAAAWLTSVRSSRSLLPLPDSVSPAAATVEPEPDMVPAVHVWHR